ncbi:hypothetical protein J4E08_10015 [Sagittula sp. NFXS13]|uniref:hypothetical protein n=1 Tax=Sagittula sp. NFXS13 TaxID=2819095 RepID=UPI0032DFD2FA
MKCLKDPSVQDAILLVGDWHWRKGPRLSAWLAWAFGRREVFVTHLDDVACVAWWRGNPYLIDLSERTPQ